MNGTQFGFAARSNTYSAHVIIGSLGRNEFGLALEFGNEAEVYVDLEDGDAKVSQSAIRSHSPERARLRIQAYQLATDLAVEINRRLEEPEYGFNPEHIRVILDQIRVGYSLEPLTDLVGGA